MGEEPNHNCKKAWSCLNHSILSGQLPLTGITDQGQSYSGQKKSPQIIWLSVFVFQQEVAGRRGSTLGWESDCVCVTIELAFLCVSDSPCSTDSCHPGK